MNEGDEIPDDEIIILPTNVGNFAGNELEEVERREEKDAPIEFPNRNLAHSGTSEIVLRDENPKQKESAKQKLKSHSVKDLHTWIKGTESQLKSAGTTPVFKEANKSRLDFKKSLSGTERGQSNSATTSPARKSSPFTKERANLKEEDEKKSLLDEEINSDEKENPSEGEGYKVDAFDQNIEEKKHENFEPQEEQETEQPAQLKKKKTKKKKGKKKMPIINEEDDEGKVRESSELFQKKAKKKKKSLKQPIIGKPIDALENESHVINLGEQQGSKRSKMPDSKFYTNDHLTYEKIRSRELEDKIIGWNIASYLYDKRVPKYNKLFLLFFMISFLTSLVLSSIELNYFATSICNDSFNHGMVYFNFFLMFCYKFAILNFVNLEVFHTLPLELKYPFAVPILGFGIFPVMQMPQYTFDFIECLPRSKVFTLDNSFVLTNLFGYFQIILIASFLMIAGISTTCIIPNRFLKQARNVCYFLIILITLAANGVSILMSLSQVQNFVPSMFLENIIYWFLILTMIYSLCIKRYWNQEVFQTIQDESQNETKSVSIKSNMSSQTGSFNMGNLVVVKGKL